MILYILSPSTLRPPSATLFPYTTLFRSLPANRIKPAGLWDAAVRNAEKCAIDITGKSANGGSSGVDAELIHESKSRRDRKSTRLNSSHTVISYAVFCLKKKKNKK